MNLKINVFLVFIFCCMKAVLGNATEVVDARAIAHQIAPNACVIKLNNDSFDTEMVTKYFSDDAYVAYYETNNYYLFMNFKPESKPYANSLLMNKDLSTIIEFIPAMNLFDEYTPLEFFLNVREVLVYQPKEKKIYQNTRFFRDPMPARVVDFVERKSYEVNSPPLSIRISLKLNEASEKEFDLLFSELQIHCNTFDEDVLNKCYIGVENISVENNGHRGYSTLWIE